ncbi:CDP-glycerol--glycerophosphate glycerophosphotransferase [Oceanobacillus iheyensis]|nr:CDP-glycerol--glycerophosphate glycerophosphotransferase [Oceanobacillus iheyensis]
MVKELFITIYLFVFRIVFNLFKLLPQKKKTVCVASFGDNIFYSVDALRSISDEEIIILKDASCRYPFDASEYTLLAFDLKHPFSFLKSMYHLATGSTILIDTYHPFLSVTNFKTSTVCIQLWHAAGAIKHFGLMDPTNEYRSAKAIERFKNVYDSFTYAVVGSENMADTFKDSFGLSDSQILRTGIPRSDVLFDNKKKQEVYKKIVQENLWVADKKIILYAPTFRNDQLSNFQLQLNIEQLYASLSDEYVLFIKPHPAVSYEIKDMFKEFVLDVSSYYDTNELLLVTDILISDYSSIPFEFAILEKPMIFFAYDMDEYKVTSGLIDNYENQMPGPVVFSTEAIISSIREKNFNYKDIKDFAKRYNAYSDGSASLNLAKFLTETGERQKEKVSI